MKLSLWHWFYCTLVYASGVFVGIDSTQPLYDGKQLMSEVAGFLTPNQLADFTLSEVKELIPVLAPVLTPIYDAIGILRYPTKPLRLASENLSTSIPTFLKNKRSHDYQHMLERGLFMLVPRMYITIEAEFQQDENSMGILRTRTKKACALPREYRPVIWYDSPLDASGMPIRYNWSMNSIRTFLNESFRALGGHANREHTFEMIKILARYWRAEIGLSGAKPISWVERGFNEQYCYCDHYKLGIWMSRTLEDRRGRLRGNVVPPQIASVRNPEARGVIAPSGVWGPSSSKRLTTNVGI